MKIVHIIEADSHAQLKTAVAELYLSLYPQQTTPCPMPAVPQDSSEEVVEPVAAPVEKKTRKKSSAKEKVAQEEQTEVEETSTISAASLRAETKVEAPESAEELAAEEEPINPFEEEPEVVKEAPAAPTFADVKAALEALNEREGLDAVRNLLSKYGVQRITAIKEADYVKFLADCK